MRIDREIGVLLYQSNFVVIPEFGGFVARQKPAHVNPSGLTISPPRKDILFNPRLTASDGLLQQQLVKKYGASYSEAEIALNKYVATWNDQLNLGQSLVVQNVGMFRKNLDGKIIFKQFAQSNFLIDAFGLEIAQIAPKKVDISSNITVAQRHKPETIVIEKLPVSYQKFQRASVAAIAILTLSAGYLYMLSFNPQAIDKAGLNFFDVPIIDSADLKMLERTKQIEEVLDEHQRVVQQRETALPPKKPALSDESQLPIKTENNDVEEPKDELVKLDESPVSEEKSIDSPTPAKVLVDKDDLANEFHVIVSVLSSVDRIDAEVKKFKLKGYEPVILPVEVGKYRISIGAFATRDSADTFKKNIYNDNSLDSWILKQ